MRFQAEHKIFKRPPLEFSETDAPDWLTSCRTVEGSTMDARWFWEDHVLKLKVGQSIGTDFHTITRLK
mgnify:CR=1 FL=1